jgi:hypothetical protein
MPANSAAMKPASPVVPNRPGVVGVMILAWNKPGASVAVSSSASASKNPPSDTSAAMVQIVRVIGSRSSRAVSSSAGVAVHTAVSVALVINGAPSPFTPTFRLFRRVSLQECRQAQSRSSARYEGCSPAVHREPQHLGKTRRMATDLE